MSYKRFLKIIFTLSSILKLNVSIGEVTLSQFIGYPQGSFIVLSWQTTEEINNDHFSIFRSLDSITFEYLGAIPGASQSDTTQDYLFSDYLTHTDTCTYYRLEATDFDGNISILETKRMCYYVGLNEPALPGNLHVFFDATLNKLFVQNSTYSTQSAFDLYNQEGKLIFHALNMKEELEIDCKNFSPGIYFYLSDRRIPGKIIIY